MNKIKLSLFFVLITLMIIAFNWGQIHSDSIDLVSHNALVNKIMTDGGISGGYQENLLEMKLYPPLTHYLGAGVGLLFDSSLLGLNIATLISSVIIFAIIGYFLLETGFISFLLVSIVLFLLYYSKIILPLIGYEVIENYFFPQLVTTAYFVAIFFWLYRTSQSLISRLLTLLIVINIGLFAYPLPIVILFGASIIIIFMELVREKSIKNDLGYLVLFIILVGASAFFNPYVRTIAGAAKHNGGLKFEVFTTTQLDITIWVITLIIVAGVSGLFCLWRSRNQDIKSKGSDRTILFLSAVVVSVAGLSFCQYILYRMDLSNPYAVKKYLFILFTFFVILILSQIGRLLNKSLGDFKQLSIPEKYTSSELPVFLFSTMIVFGLFNRPGIDLKPILEYQKQVKQYYQYDNAGMNLHNTISQLPIPNMFNLLITLAELQHPWDAVSQSMIGMGQLKKTDVGKVVISSSGSRYVNTIYDSGTIAVSQGIDYYTNNLKNGETINFNSIFSNRYIISGFSLTEPWGRWSDGDLSIIAITLDEIKGKELSLQFLVTPFLNEKRKPLMVDIKVNGQMSATWNFSALGSTPETKKIMVPSSLVGKENKLKIEFIYHDVTSPLELGISSDARRISLGFVNLKVGGN
ncbi:hypothetical protein [Methylobacter sp. S3L5C]|uniref:DUF7024 domain-containing protein n=1 Tax=Methylobacter sp. S3L5C TaxID=2839024 RepID=UPI001FAB7BF7|nr:hypothetical protein [Methylobacter sp. S3L5C]UOA09519.1 hypothetical protein KKZ03_04280 [Methylobacter sp. S3L5C]